MCPLRRSETSLVIVLIFFRWLSGVIVVLGDVEGQCDWWGIVEGCEYESGSYIQPYCPTGVLMYAGSLSKKLRDPCTTPSSKFPDHQAINHRSLAALEEQLVGFRSKTGDTPTSLYLQAMADVLCRSFRTSHLPWQSAYCYRSCHRVHAGILLGSTVVAKEKIAFVSMSRAPGMPHLR